MLEPQIILYDHRIDQRTGRVELHLKCRSTEGGVTWEGPVAQYSCDPQTLRDRFNGDVETFIQWAAKEHRSLVGAKPGLAEELEKRKGKAVA